MRPLTASDLPEPSAADLAAIDVEWPVIAAGIDVVNAEIALINAADRGGPSPLDWRRLRRAEAAVTRLAAELAARPTAAPRTRRRRVDAMPGPDDLAAITAQWPDIAANLTNGPTSRKAVA